jgi:hypothetical protein
MHIRRTRTPWIIAPLLLLVVLVWGCSSDYMPTSSTEQEPEQSMGTPYPPLTPENAPAGFQFLSTNTANRMDDYGCDSLVTSRYCRTTNTSVVGFPWLVSVTITSGDLPRNTTVSVVVPSDCWAVADFYPHPYQFNGTIEITWNVAAMGLPANFNYDSLIPLYVNDAGEYIPMNYEWVGGHNQLIVYTNHFSRYIIGQRIMM